MVNRGEDAHTDGKFAPSHKTAMEIMKLFFTLDEQLYDKRITNFFDDEVLNSNFWLYWRTMFAFENWHSTLEMKLYIKRFIHHVGGLPDFKALRFTRDNQYDSMILPMLKYLSIYIYIYTDGEPLVCKKDLIYLCEKHSDCIFLSFTNATLINEAFADKMLRVKNFVPAISLEGSESATNGRRGDGVYGKVMQAIELLHRKKWSTASPLATPVPTLNLLPLRRSSTS